MFPSNNNPTPNWMNQNSNQLKWQQALNQNKPGGYPFDPYQVKASDTFDSIAQTTGFDVPSLQQANNGMLVPPPKGSYINVPKPPQQYVGQGVSIPTSAPPLYGPPLPPATVPGVPTIGEGRGDPAMQALRQSFQQTAQQLAAGQFPPSISATVAGNIINPATGKPYTPQDYAAAGYTFNPATGSYTQPGAGGGASLGALGKGDFYGYEYNPETGRSERVIKNAATSNFTNELRWDPERKKFIKIGQLVKEGRLDLRTGRLRRGRQRPEEQAAAPAPEATNAGTQPGQQLNVNQGGG